PVVLIVTSSGAPSSAVVPVLAAIEAAGMRVRAIDVGAAGGGGGGMADRVRRALLGEGAERRLRKELEMSPPDAAVVFDPHSALALTVVRDQVPAIAGSPAPVIGIVDELEPGSAWAQTDCDRFVAVDELAAVALADAGVEGDRILVVGAIGERAFAEAGLQDRAALRSRFKLGSKTALVEVAGLGGEHTGQLALQLSLLDGGDQITFLFDAAGDVDAAAVLRRQVPALGLRAKLFGATPDAPLFWRAADIIVARPRPEVVARVQLVGGRLVALVDDSIAGAAKVAAALEARKRAITSKGLLLLSSALDSAFTGTPPPPTADGSDNIADIVAAVAGDKRGVIDERRAVAQAQTRDRVRAATTAAQAAAATTAMPGDLEDLGGEPVEDVPLPDPAELSRLRGEVERRKQEMTKSMMAARDAATTLSAEAAAARMASKADEATTLDRRADAERARMHGLLAELATLETELAELERVRKTINDAPRPPPRAAGAGGATGTSDMPRASAPRPPSLDDALNDLKKRAGSPGGAPPPRSNASSSGSANPSSGPRSGRAAPTNVEDELAALKKKMANAPPKKK
ncbi:MAG: hypothetical protein H0T89_35150, partial [Deltaproteobacteria bacterium]|nr:hypothetical protein [Deltaproteobacteria bacterium]